MQTTPTPTAVKTSQKLLYNIDEVSDMLGVHPNTLHTWKNRGDIEFTRLGRKIAFTWEQIQEFLNSHRERTKVNKPSIPLN